jgi:hypothetical protein
MTHDLEIRRSIRKRNSDGVWHIVIQKIMKPQAPHVIVKFDIAHGRAIVY